MELRTILPVLGIVFAACPEVLAVPTRSSDAQDALGTHARAVGGVSGPATRAVLNLERLAEWCDRVRLYRQRDAAFRSILAVDPDHPHARRALKYERARDGTWIAPRSYREPTDVGTPRLGEFRRLRDEVVGEIRRECLDPLRTGSDPRSVADRRAILAALLVLEPEDEALRGELGEVREPCGKHWILVESARVRSGEPDLATVAREIVGSVAEPQPIVPLPRELDLGVAWEEAVGTDRIRVLAADPGAAATECARLAEATLLLSERALRLRSRTLPGFTVYLLSNPASRRALLTRHRAVGASRAGELERFDSFWVFEERELVVCARSLDLKLDQTVRQAVSRALFDQFRLLPDGCVLHAGITARLVALVRAARGDPTGAADTPVCGLPAHLHLTDLLRRKTAKPTALESEASCALACYLMEGWPVRLPALLGTVGSGVGLDTALETDLGFDLATLEERYARWVVETR